MNFQQLRIIRETHRGNYSLTEVASALAPPQSDVSKHLKDIKAELGVELFVRRGKRLLSLIEPRREISWYIEQVLTDNDHLLCRIAKRSFLHGFTYRFIEACRSDLTEPVVKAAIGSLLKS